MRQSEIETPLKKYEVPFKADFHIMFHDHKVFRINVDAKIDSLSLLLTTAQGSGLTIWKGDFKADYLENICQKTGRELTYN